MRQTLSLRLVAALLVLAVLGPGCAARWAYRQGQDARDRGDWDLAVARYTRALEKDPNNITYKIALENARVQASRLHYDRARKQLAANDLEKAAEELQIASNYDPANRSAADDLAIVRDRIRRREDEARERGQIEEMQARARARMPVPLLSPRANVPITTNFRNTSLQRIFESLGKIAGVNVLFDEGFRDKPNADAVLTGITFEQALDRLTFVHRLFYKVLDQNTIIIVPESRQKRTAYDELVLRTFYLQNAEINDVVNVVKQLAKVQTVAGNQSIGAVTVLGTLDQVAVAERLIAANDKARGEVVVEVQILEVNRTKAREWGIDLSNYTASATLSPTGAQGEVANGLLNVRAHVLSSLNLADWVIQIPSTIFTRFIQSESTTRILASPKLRAAEGKQAELRIGTEVPIPVTSYTVGVGNIGNQGSYFPATSFTYRNVGVNLTMTPRVAASGDITLEMAAEFSLLGADRNVGSSGNPINVPTFLTRNVKGVLRLRDGETGLIGGLLQSADASSFAGALGMSDIPLLGKLFGARERTRDEQEVVISITPRVVRAPKLTEIDMVPMRVGTQEVPRVQGARPPLFGTEPEPPAGGAPATPQAPVTTGPTSAPGAGGVPTPTGPTSAPGAGGIPTPTGPTSAPGAGGVPTPTGPTSAPGPEAAPPTVPPSELPPEEIPPEDAPPGLAALTTRSRTPPAGSAAPKPVAPTAAAATGGTTAVARPVTVLFSPPEAALRVGQQGSVAVVLVGAKDVHWVEVVVGYDPALAKVTAMAPGSLLTLDGSPVSAERQIETGRARARFLRPTAASGSGAVAAITLVGLKPGSGSFVIESIALGRPNGTERPAPPAAARLVVTP
jgi:general secretion pathway protein D